MACVIAGAEIYPVKPDRSEAPKTSAEHPHGTMGVNFPHSPFAASAHDDFTRTVSEASSVDAESTSVPRPSGSHTESLL